MKRPVALLTILVSVAVSLAAGTAPADAAVLDGTCVASITLNFTPPATQPLPPNPAPAATSTGTGTITTCVFPGGGPSTGTLSYTLTGNLTCTSAQNVTGTLDITWSDTSHTHATVTGLLSAGSVGGTAGLSATITSGRFTGDQILIANLRERFPDRRIIAFDRAALAYDHSMPDEGNLVLGEIQAGAPDKILTELWLKFIT